MSENNYGALMMKSAVSANVDIDNILLPGIYPISSGNQSSPDVNGGILTVHPGETKRRTFTSDSITFATSSYNETSLTWEEWSLSLSHNDLSSYDGLGFVGQCPDIAQLRMIKFDAVGKQIFLKEHTSGQRKGGGIWYCHALVNDNSYVDDNGCQIINNAGQVLRRKDLTKISSELFGLQAGDSIDTVIDNMYIASRSFNIEEVWIHHPGFGEYYTSAGGHEFSIGDGLGFYIRGVSSGSFGPTIYHYGNTKLFRIYKNYSTASQFWVSGGYFNLRITGRSDDMTTDNSNKNAIALEASDMWGCQFKGLFISGYTGNSGGCAISLYNDSAWTEGTEFENIIIRSSVVGIWMHRNTADGATGTNSFFRTHGNFEINAGVSSTAVNYLKIGDGTSAGSCTLYGHDLTIIGWMSAGAWHTGVNVTDYSNCVAGAFKFVWDGYGISTGASSEVIHFIRANGANARFDCEVMNLSGQGLTANLSLLQLIWNSCIYTQESTANNASLDAAYPVIRAKGLRINFAGTFTIAERVSGLTYSLTSLLPGQRLRVRLHSWSDDKWQPQTSEWEVVARGTDTPCIITPLVSASATLATESANALINTSGSTGNFLKTAVITDTPFVQNSTTGSTTLTLTNGQENNSTSYAVNSGRKIYIALPANAAAITNMPYKVEIEVL